MSILIPAYNAEHWIAQTIESALRQTWPRREIIVVDDGSSDNTLSVVRQYEPEGVQSISQVNQGPSSARNHAYSLSSGDYIQWLDADDILAPDKVERQLDVLLACEDGVLASGAWGHFFYRTSRARFTPTPLWCDLSPLEWLTRKFEHTAFIQTACWLVSRDLAEKAGPWNPQLSVDDDGEYFARAIMACREVRFIADSKVFYRRVGSHRMSHIGASDSKLESQLRADRLQVEYIRSLADTDRVRAACAHYAQASLAIYYPARPDLAEELRSIARGLGADLRPGWLRPKYAWLRLVLGFAAAKRMQKVCPQIRMGISRGWDKWCYERERQRVSGSSEL